jgi:translocation and assembly module TamB
LLVLVALGALAIVAAVAIAWALGSEQGSAWLIERLEARASPAVSIGRVSGSLLGGLTLAQIEVRLPSDELDIATMSLSWNALAAWSGVLELQAVRIGPVAYRRLPATGAASEPAAIDLPIEIRIREAIAESLTLSLGGETLAFGETTAAARFGGGRLLLERLTTETSGVALAAEGEVRLAESIGLDVRIDWSRPSLDLPQAGRLSLSGDLPVLTVHHELAPPYTVVADGELTVGSPLRADLTIEWRDLAPPGVSGVTSRRGRLVLAGAVEDFVFDGSADIHIADEDASVALRGTGRNTAVMLEAFLLESARGTFTATGDVAVDTREAILQIGARDFDPSWLLPDWPGRLTGSAGVRASLAPLAWEVDALDVIGELRGHPIAATGAIASPEPRRLRLDQVRVESGPSNVVLDGELGGAPDQVLKLRVAANIADLSVLQPDLGGSLVADLALEGSWRVPRGTGTIEAFAVELEGYSAERLRLAGQFGLGARDPLDLAIEADVLARSPIVVASVRGTIVGTAQAHQITVDAGAERWESHAGVTGGLADATWRGTLQTLEIDEMALGAWRLTGPAAAAIGRDIVALDTSCLLHQSGGQWCAEVRIEGVPEDRLVISAQNFQLASLQPLLPPQLSLRGVYQLSASFSDLTGEPRGALVVSGASTPVSVGFSDQQVFETVLEDLTVGATLIAGQFDLQASVMSRATGELRIQTRIDDVRAQDSPISGTLNASWSDLGFLSLVSPDVGDIRGSLEADLRVVGTVSEPHLQGSARWDAGQVAVPEWGLVIDRIQADASSPDGRRLQFSASGWVEDAELRLEGATELDPAAGWPTRLTVRGESIRAVQLTDVEIFVSPDLSVRAELPDVQVTGTVHIPRARIQISQLPEAAIAPSPDAVVHGAQAVDEFRSLRVRSDILLTLGEDVDYSGLNLTTDVSGQLRVVRDSGRSTTASGSLMLAGTYDAYGQTLQLERGQLLFNGPLDDPALDVRAVRTIEETTRVGVELVGTVKSPRTRIFSDPAMSEADALSYLLLGRPVSGTDAAETPALQSAALAMGLRQALPVVQRIGQSLGLDEFTVQGTATDAGALMAGKYLSPRVFIRYSYGLFNRIGGLLLRFRVNERLSIETRSGDQKSMDLLYTVEKD